MKIMKSKQNFTSLKTVIHTFLLSIKLKLLYSHHFVDSKVFQIRIFRRQIRVKDEKFNNKIVQVYSTKSIFFTFPIVKS